MNRLQAPGYRGFSGALRRCSLRCRADIVFVMLTYLFAVAAAVHILLFLATLRLRAGYAEWIVRLLLLGLVFDNVVLALGTLAFDESWYFGASWFRYLAHVLVLPPLALAALQLAERGGVSWAEGQAAKSGFLLFVVAAVAYGLVFEIASLELVREELFGHQRYVSNDALPPLATIVTNLVVLIVAIALWRSSAWPWLFAAALTILLVNGMSAGKEWGIIAGNVAEVVFLLGWVASLFRFQAVVDSQD